MVAPPTTEEVQEKDPEAEVELVVEDPEQGMEEEYNEPTYDLNNISRIKCFSAFFKNFSFRAVFRIRIRIRIRMGPH
jgi:hypothetical protein